MATLSGQFASITLPAGWEKAPQSNSAQLAAIGPQEKSGRPSVIVSTEPLGAHRSAASFADAQKAELRDALDNFIPGPSGERSWGKLQGVVREHSFTLHGQGLTQVQFYAVHRQRVVVFTYTCAKPDGARAAAQLEVLVRGTTLVA